MASEHKGKSVPHTQPGGSGGQAPADLLATCCSPAEKQQWSRFHLAPRDREGVLSVDTVISTECSEFRKERHYESIIHA